MSCNNPCTCSMCQERKHNCEQRATLDYVPGTAAVIGLTLDGITDTLDLKDGVLNVESKTQFKLNTITGNLEYWNESYVATEDSSYLQTVPVSELLKYGNIEDLGNVDTARPKAGDILYYVADASCGPECVGVNDKWVKLRAPTEDGTYKLTMTVTNGAPTLSWEEEQ